MERDNSITLTWLGLPFADVPAGRSKEHSRYTLVTYDSAGRGRFLQSGIVLNPTRTTSPLVSDYSKLYLRAGEMLLIVDKDWNLGVNLLVSPAVRDEYLIRARSMKRCLFLLGCDSRACPNQLKMDGHPPHPLPLRSGLGYLYVRSRKGSDPLLKDMNVFSSGPWLEVLNAIALEPGEHALQFSATQIDGAGRLPLSCKPGGVQYVLIDPASDGREFTDWRFKTMAVMPSQFAERPLLLIADSQWRVDQEAGN